MKKLLYILIIFVLAQPVKAQSSIDTVAVDTVRLSLEDLYLLMLKNHPLLQQANLNTDIAEQEIRYARGFFDPKIELAWDNKQLNDTEYFNRLTSELKIPLWFPIDPSISVDRAFGDYLNPENFISPAQNFYQLKAGVSLPIGQGLFIDSRRAMVQKAQLLPGMLEAERIKEANKVFLTANKDYWNWYRAYNDFKIYDQSLDIAEEILRRTKLNYQLGEASMIDTVQASITLQDRKIQRQESYIEFIQSGLSLSNHLWDEEGRPLEIPETMIPVHPEEDIPKPTEWELDSLMEFAKLNHPELVKLRNKGEQLGIEERLNKEMLKPVLNVNYNLINRPLDPNVEFTGFAFSDDYIVGIDFGIPLFLRKERSKLKLTQFQILENTWQTDYTNQQITNEIQSVYTQLVNTRLLLVQQYRAVQNYERILEAELLNLETGESDLFKINFQQSKLLESRSKWFKQRSQYEKLKAALIWSSGYEMNPVQE